MHTTIAFSESQDAGGADVAVAGAADQHIRVEGDDIYVPELSQLVGALSCSGDSATRSYLVSPSLRRVNPYEIAPLGDGLVPQNVGLHTVRPGFALPLQINEPLNAHLTANPGSAEQGTIVAFLAQGPLESVRGQIFTVRFTITLALVAGSWEFSNITFVDELPIQNYRVVGAHLVASTAVAFRFVPVGGQWRPGAPVAQDTDKAIDPVFRMGGLGNWFSFNPISPPGVEVISSAAAGSATYNGAMDIMAA